MRWYSVVTWLSWVLSMSGAIGILRGANVTGRVPAKAPNLVVDATHKTSTLVDMRFIFNIFSKFLIKLVFYRLYHNKALNYVK